MPGNKKLTEDEWTEMQQRWQHYHDHLMSSGAPVLQAATFLNKYLKDISVEYLHRAANHERQF
jgi:hypothetical protein